MSVFQIQCLIWTQFQTEAAPFKPDINHSELEGRMGNTRWPNEDKVSMPSTLTQQGENWAHAARLSALCALWQGY